MATPREDANDMRQDSFVERDAKLRARRKILLGGVGAAPVVMSVSSPALAGTNCGAGNVATPSAAVSGNLSRPLTYTSSGFSPGYWKNHLNWPAPYVAVTGNGKTATTFKSVFTTNYPAGWGASTSTRPTLLDVISPDTYGSGGNPCNNSSPYTAFARACVASLLNAAAGAYVDSSTGQLWLTPATIIDMWAKAGAGGNWPVPGTNPVVYWNYSQLTTYLVRIWDVTGGCTC